jgi:TatD DNase family protein
LFFALYFSSAFTRVHLRFQITWSSKLIDTHCHLTFPDFDRDRDDMLQRAADAGVSGFVTVSTDAADWQRCLDLCEGRTQLRVALGVHPNHSSEYSAALLAQMKALALANSRVVALGETGLDFFRDNSPREKQYAAFRDHLRLTGELNKPFILHCRAAEVEMLEVLTEHRGQTGAQLRGVWHCFTSTRVYANRARELDLYFGIGGVVTYPKADELRAAVAELPANRILLETDCPFLPPQGWRGQRNEPAYLTKVVEVIAQVRKTTPDEVTRVTTENAKRLFGLE